MESATLDPRDWETLHRLGHRMVDDVVARHRGIARSKVWQPLPPATAAFFEAPLPRHPSDPEQVYQDFLRHVAPYPTGNAHPRFWGWALGTGTTSGAFADMLAAAMNANVVGGEQAPAWVERQVVRWLAELLGYPTGASGLLLSGGSMANLVGLAVALHQVLRVGSWIGSTAASCFGCRRRAPPCSPTPRSVAGWPYVRPS